MKRNLKLILAYIVLIAFGNQAKSQTDITLIIKDLAGQQIDKIEAFDYSQIEMLNPKIADTIQLKFSKNTINCYVLRFHSQNKKANKQIWLDPGTVTVHGHLNRLNLIIDTVINAPVYYKINEFQNTYSKLLKKSDVSEMNQFLLTSFKEHADDPFSITIGIYYLMLNINSKENLAKLKTETDRQGNKFGWYITAPNLHDRLNTVLTLDKLDLKNFQFTSLENKMTNISLKGSDYTVINFWFEGCHPCEEEMPGFNKLVERYDEKDVNFLAIGLNSPKDIEDFLKRKPFNFDHIAYGEPLIRDTFKSVWGYPLTLVADKQMRIVFVDHGGPDDTTAITKIQKKLIQVIETALVSN